MQQFKLQWAQTIKNSDDQFTIFRKSKEFFDSAEEAYENYKIISSQGDQLDYPFRLILIIS